MSQYIQIISKLKQKNNQTYKLMDLTDVEVNFQTEDYNILCSSGSTITKSGIDWDLNEHYCTIGGLTNINGDLHISGALFEDSDRQLKSNIIVISNPLQTIKNIEGVQFNWKKDNKLDYGMIAQEVQKIIPQMVSLNNSTGYKQISYIKLIPFLLEGLKELNNKIEILELQKSKKCNLKHFLSRIIKIFCPKFKVSQ